MEANDIIPTVELDVSGLPPEHRFEAFAALVKNSRTTAQSPGSFDVQARFWHLGPIVISELATDAMVYDRTPKDIHGSGSDHYSVVLLIEGECVFRYGDETRTLLPGGVSFSDFATPERVETTAQRSISIQIAKPVLDQVVPPVASRGPLPDSPECQMLFSFCRTLIDLLPTMKTSNALRMAGIVRDLLASALSNLPARSEDLRENQLRERVARYIATQPAGEIEIAAICKSLNVTRSSLFRAFKRYGGVMAYDRRRRLHALHRALADPRDRRAIAELGYLYGFEDKAHMSRLFRKTFGYSASEFRRHPVISQRGDAPLGSVQERYRSSVATLASENYF